MFVTLLSTRVGYVRCSLSFNFTSVTSGSLLLYINIMFCDHYFRKLKDTHQTREIEGTRNLSNLQYT